MTLEEVALRPVGHGGSFRADPAPFYSAGRGTERAGERCGRWG